MATDLKNESLYSLQMYVQFAETLSGEMSQFLEDGARRQLEAGKVSQNYFDELEQKIGGHIYVQNQLLKKIEKEIQSRIRKKFPELVSFRQLELMGKSLDDEIERHKNLLGPVDESSSGQAPVIAPNFSVSREKKHDKE